MKSYSKNEKVTARLNEEVGTIVDHEDNVRFGWLYQVSFADGTSKWFKSCEIRG